MAELRPGLNRAHWLFEDWPDGTTLRVFQVLDTTLLRLAVLVAFRPLRKLLRRLS